MCYHGEFVGSALKDVGINTGEPTKWGALELCSLRMGDWLTIIHARPDMCYHVKFGSSVTRVYA